MKRNLKIQVSEIKSLPYSLQTNQDCDDNSSIESIDALEVYLIETHGRKLTFRECYHLACGRNPIYVCMEHDLCGAEPTEPLAGPASDDPKSIETNKTPI
mgnify:CR=1 FL=1